MNTKPLEWIATSTIIFGALALANGFAFWSSVAFFTGSAVWGIIALIWQKPSMIVLNGFLCGIYIWGWIFQ